MELWAALPPILVGRVVRGVGGHVMEINLLCIVKIRGGGHNSE